MAEKNDNKAAAAEGGAKKKPPMLMIVVGVAVVAMIAMFLIGKQVSAKSKPAAPKPVEHGPTMALDEFLVNLSDPGGDHFLEGDGGAGSEQRKGQDP